MSQGQLKVQGLWEGDWSGELGVFKERAAREDLGDPEFGRGALFASKPRQGEKASRESDVSEALEYFLTTLPPGKRVAGLDGGDTGTNNQFLCLL